VRKNGKLAPATEPREYSSEAQAKVVEPQPVAQVGESVMQHERSLARVIRTLKVLATSMTRPPVFATTRSRLGSEVSPTKGGGRSWSYV